MSEDITKIHHVEMTFDHTIAFDIQEIANSNNFEIADIAEIECGKWAHLHITLKDGRVITEDGCNYGEVDMKWASAEYFYDKNYNDATKNIKEYLESVNLYSIGRFGEWEYYNMDICMESAMKLVKKING